MLMDVRHVAVPVRLETLLKRKIVKQLMIIITTITVSSLIIILIVDVSLLRKRLEA